MKLRTITAFFVLSLAAAALAGCPDKDGNTPSSASSAATTSSAAPAKSAAPSGGW